MIDEMVKISWQAPNRAELGQLAKRFNVSTKTISRWRALGLVSRRLVFDGRKRVGFLRSSVDRFVKNHSERVERGTRFSQLTDQQRQENVDRARQLAHAGGGQEEATGHPQSG